MNFVKTVTYDVAVAGGGVAGVAAAVEAARAGKKVVLIEKTTQLGGLATIGLIDSDATLFKNYIQVFFKTGFTVIIQVTLMSLAFRVAATFHILNLCAAIALMVTALSSPKLLQQFLVPSGGGGGLSQKIYSVSMVARSAKMLLR